MKISDLSFVSDEPAQKTLKIGENEYPIRIKQLSCGDYLTISASTAPRNIALIAAAVIFDDGQMTEAQAARLDVQTAATLLELVGEVNALKN